MNFAQTVVSSLFSKYCTFKGRATRSEFLLFLLFVSLLCATFVFVFNASLLCLALVFPTLGAAIRRLHDSDLSGYWLSAPLLPGIVGGTFVFLDMIPLAFACLISSFILGVYLYLRPSSRTPNKYGVTQIPFSDELKCLHKYQGKKLEPVVQASND